MPSMITIYLIAAIAGMAAIGVAGWKGYEMGKDRGEVLCNNRVAVLLKKIDDANVEIEQNKKKHKEEIDLILSANDDAVKIRDAENEKLEEKLVDLEARYAGSTQCVLDKSTADELR